MSSLKMQNVIDPRLECLEFAQKENVWGVFKGCEGQNLVVQNANSYSTSGVAWNFNTQSENTIIDRRVYARCQFLMTFTGTAPIGTPLLNNECDAPRCLPLASITNSLKVTINGSSVETQYSDVLQALLRYNLDNQVKETDLSMSPSCLDKYQRYEDGVGSIRNPLSNYQNSGKDTGRGTFAFDNIVNPPSPDNNVTVLTATVLFTVTEPLLISPMLYKSRDLQSGLIGVKNIGVQFNFSAGQIERIWSRAPSGGVTIATAVASIGPGATAPPSLLVNYLTPPLISQGQIPRSVDYQYYKAECFVNDMNTIVNTGGSQSFTNNSIQLSTVPRAIYIYASRPNNTKTYLTTDTFFRINSLSLNYLNVSGQFSSMPIQSLYQMCVKNGCDLSWSEWSGRSITIGSSPGGAGALGLGSIDGLVGSVIKIDISDLHIPSNIASGMNVNSQLSYTVGVENIHETANLGVQLTTVLVYDGLMTVANGSMATAQGIISESDVIAVRSDRQNYVDYKSAQSIYAGSLYGEMGHIASMGKKGLDVVCSLKDAMGGDLRPSALKRDKCPSGSRKVDVRGCLQKKKGGELMSRSQLKARLFD